MPLSTSVLNCAISFGKRRAGQLFYTNRSAQYCLFPSAQLITTLGVCLAMLTFGHGGALPMQSSGYGDSLTSCLVAIVVPDPEVLAKFAKDNGIQGDMVALCKDPKVIKKVMSQMTSVGKVGAATTAGIR